MEFFIKNVLNLFLKYFDVTKLVIYLTLFLLFFYFAYVFLTELPKPVLFVLAAFCIIYALLSFINKIIAKNKNTKIKKQAIIIGAGISGIAAAYYLQKKNIPYIILEKASELGGTWRDLKFHGSRVDTENVEYCFSFDIVLDEKNTNWSRSEVLNYMLNVAKKFNIFPHIKFNKTVTKVNFDSSQKKWFVSTSDENIYCADFLYNCNGFSNTSPYIPEFNGMNDFKNEIIHSVHLNESQTFHDKNVVIVGSGATMASTVPTLVKVCKSLTILQRSPSYIYETDCKPDAIWKLVIKLDNLGIPKIKQLFQVYRMIDSEIVFMLIRHFKGQAKKFFRMQWEDVADKEFIDTHLTPKYNALEQRIAVSTGLKELIKTNRIKFETGEISHFTSNEIVMKSQKNIPCDVCILATGFNFNFFTFPIEVDGLTINTKRINYYKGLLLGDVPNYFQATGCFDCSWTQRVESAYFLSAQIIEYMAKKNLSVIKVPKKAGLESTFVFKPNYILRKKDDIPVVYGITHNPTYDYFFSFRLKNCKDLLFSK